MCEQSEATRTTLCSARNWLLLELFSPLRDFDVYERYFDVFQGAGRFPRNRRVSRLELNKEGCSCVCPPSCWCGHQPIASACDFQAERDDERNFSDETVEEHRNILASVFVLCWRWGGLPALLHLLFKLECSPASSSCWDGSSPGSHRDQLSLG